MVPKESFPLCDGVGLFPMETSFDGLLPSGEFPFAFRPGTEQILFVRRVNQLESTGLMVKL